MNKKIPFILSLLLPFSLISAMDVPYHLARAQKEADIENGLYTPLISQSDRQAIPSYAATYQPPARPTISYVPDKFRVVVRDKSSLLSKLPRELQEEIFKFVQYESDHKIPKSIIRREKINELLEWSKLCCGVSIVVTTYSGAILLAAILSFGGGYFVFFNHSN